MDHPIFHFTLAFRNVILHKYLFCGSYYKPLISVSQMIMYIQNIVGTSNYYLTMLALRFFHLSSTLSLMLLFEFVIPLSFTKFTLSSCLYMLFLCHCWNTNPHNGSFVFCRVHCAIRSIGYLFVIHELLWHTWQLYSQQYPPLALMETFPFGQHFIPLW